MTYGVHVPVPHDAAEMLRSPKEVGDNLSPLDSENLIVEAFRSAARSVPAYKILLAEAGVSPDAVTGLPDFQRAVPVLDKQSTFGRFGVAELCRGGSAAGLAWVLTSSGHSGQFAYGVCGREGAEAAARSVDDALDRFLDVYKKPTLLINCLPMGVRVYTRACALAETSVRADMVTAVVKAFGGHYDQIVLVGETAFLKHLLELGRSRGAAWESLKVHAIVGEEPLAENARTYLAGLLGIDLRDPDHRLIISSMGVAELGLNLFFETPALIALRRVLARDESLRRRLLPSPATNLPMLFTYDANRIFVEVLAADRLVVSTLDADIRIPLIRYATGDCARWFDRPDVLREAAAAAGIRFERVAHLPVLMVLGRGGFVRAGDVPIYPEQVKEGLYADPALARLTTANFRLRSGKPEAALRIQLVPGAPAERGLDDRFAKAVAPYVVAPLRVVCEEYEAFGNGMALDYERKFDYLEGE
jgi:phenylacetate-CoA ligase